MAHQLLEVAIFRLDAAVTRAEAALAASTLTTPTDPTLAARHADLRASTEAAIARLDRLIESEPD